MEKETLEEVAEKYNDDFQIKGGSKAPHIKNVHIMNHFIEGAKWQQEKSYSEEEVKFQANKLLNDLLYKQGFNTNVIGGIVNEWFEQFKKK